MKFMICQNCGSDKVTRKKKHRHYLKCRKCGHKQEGDFI